MKFRIKGSEYSFSLQVTALKPKDSLGALQASIAKYDFILEFLKGRDPKEKMLFDDGGVETCGCCRLYYGNKESYNGGNCEGCPIYDLTGDSDCRQTPYYDRNLCRTTGGYLKWAQRERDFLVAVHQLEFAKQEVENARAKAEKFLGE